LNDLMARAALSELGVDITADIKAGEGFGLLESGVPDIPRAEPGAFQKIKSSVQRHGEQRILPDDCEFGDNELCYVEA